MDIKNAIKRIQENAVEIIPHADLEKKLVDSAEKEQPLKIKVGFDPTAKDLHLGHLVLLNKLKTFQDIGHTIILIIGDYTAQVGDPSGKSETRPKLTKKEVLENSKTYYDQVFQVLDKSKVDVVYNSKWFSAFSFSQVLELTSQVTIARMLERDDFQKRYQVGNPISLMELLYPVMQGYDSVAIQADIELGGTDQKFNLLMGRQMQIAHKQPPQIIFTMPILEGLDGKRKMSKSLNNYIGVKEKPIDIYGKIMSISDSLMWRYYELLTNYTAEKIKKLQSDVQQGERHPKKVKSQLAELILKQVASSVSIEKIEKEWNQIHNPNHRGIPQNIDAIDITITNTQKTILDVIQESQLLSSRSEVRRAIQSGALYCVHKDGNDTEDKISKLDYPISTGVYIFRFGKRKFQKVVLL